MCLHPNFIKELGVTVGCRKCWQCVQKAQLDWVGRCIAEYKTSTIAHDVTLTYGRDPDQRPDHERATVLFYSDVQKWFKRLRKDGFKFRYFVVGEYGSEHGRSHWHLLIFWQGPAPKVQLKTRRVQGKWNLGWSYWREPSLDGIRYMCKYIQKDQGDEERQGHLSMSKKPPLGTEYFQELADKYVCEGVAPQDLFYTFPEARRQNGERLKFQLQGKTAENFLTQFLQSWKSRRPKRHLPNSELIEKFQDRQATEEDGGENWEEKFRDIQKTKSTSTLTLGKPFRPLWADEFSYSEKLNTWVAVDNNDNGKVLFWTFDEKGVQGWHGKIRGIQDAA